MGWVDGDESSCPIKASNIVQLQRAVIGSLERNCYMQIESCVARYGICDRTTLEREMVAVCLKYETLRAVKDIIALSQWSTMKLVRDGENGSHSLIDLAPHILRDICAGVCTWVCLRGQELHHRGLLIASGEMRAESEEEHLELLRAVHYTEAATTLRNAVATATSHKDTEQMVAHLNKEVDSLKRFVNDHQSSLQENPVSPGQHSLVPKQDELEANLGRF